MNFIKVKRRYVVYAFIITILFFGCMNIKTHVKQVKNPYVQKRLDIDIKYKKGGTNFVFLIKESEPVFKDLCELIPGPCETMVESTASGIVLSSDKNAIFVLTAAHFCAPSQSENFISKENIHGFANDQPRQLYPIKIDKKNDLCMLIGPKFKSDFFYNIKLASKFTIGEEVYSAAAPLGIGGPGLRLIFKGNLGGCDENGCLTTIPATFGSSGAGILNKKGELITIVMAVPEGFENVIISPSNQSLVKFIKDIDAELDIYPY